MEEKICRQCTNFIQHYGLRNHKLYKLYCGHCARGSPKRPDAKACNSFAPVSDEEDPFATKAYLSKELLEYVLKMDLLPEILDGIPPKKDKGGR